MGASLSLSLYLSVSFPLDELIASLFIILTLAKQGRQLEHIGQKQAEEPQQNAAAKKTASHLAGVFRRPTTCTD